MQFKAVKASPEARGLMRGAYDLHVHSAPDVISHEGMALFAQLLLKAGFRKNDVHHLAAIHPKRVLAGAQGAGYAHPLCSLTIPSPFG